MADAARETLEIPQRVRDEVHARDQHHCRFCGRYDEFAALHHCLFGGSYVGMGGRRIHDARFIITVGFLPGHTCHQAIHNSKNLWLPYSIAVVNHPGVSMLQLRRWRERSIGRPSAKDARE